MEKQFYTFFFHIINVFGWINGQSPENNLGAKIRIKREINKSFYNFLYSIRLPIFSIVLACYIYKYC